MSTVRRAVAGLRGDRVTALAAEVGEIRELVLAINHRVTLMSDQVGEIHQIVTELNHDVRSGGAQGLPLFLGHAEQLRVDAETAVAASQVIERQLSFIEDRLVQLAPPRAPSPDG